MTTVMEAPTMTHKQAEEAIREWQTKLDTARSALQQAEAGIGQLALAAGADKATERITRLQVEVKMAEAGLAGAQIQRDAVRRQEQLARAAALREEWAELDRQANEHGALIRELEPKLNHAHQNLQYIAHRMSTIERNIEDIEHRHGKVVPA